MVVEELVPPGELRWVQGHSSQAGCFGREHNAALARPSTERHCLHLCSPLQVCPLLLMLLAGA